MCTFCYTSLDTYLWLTTSYFTISKFHLPSPSPLSTFQFSPPTFRQPFHRRGASENPMANSTVAREKSEGRSKAHAHPESIQQLQGMAEICFRNEKNGGLVVGWNICWLFSWWTLSPQKNMGGIGWVARSYPVDFVGWLVQFSEFSPPSILKFGWHMSIHCWKCWLVEMMKILWLFHGFFPKPVLLGWMRKWVADKEAHKVECLFHFHTVDGWNPKQPTWDVWNPIYRGINNGTTRERRISAINSSVLTPLLLPVSSQAAGIRCRHLSQGCWHLSAACLTGGFT